MKDAFALFTLHNVRHDDGFGASELVALAGQLKTALDKRGFEAGDVFGSSTDLQMFCIEIEDCEYSVGFSPDEGGPTRWCAQAQLDDPGWLRSTRERRLATFKRLALAIHDALIHDFEARDIEWFFDARVHRGRGTPLP
jgi:hypothetical protein